VDDGGRPPRILREVGAEDERGERGRAGRIDLRGLGLDGDDAQRLDAGGGGEVRGAGGEREGGEGEGAIHGGFSG
jgi:hypothetical protein